MDDDSNLGTEADDPDTDSESEWRTDAQDKKDCSKNKVYHLGDDKTVNKVIGKLAIIHTDVQAMPEGMARKRLE